MNIRKLRSVLLHFALLIVTLSLCITGCKNYEKTEVTSNSTVLSPKQLIETVFSMAGQQKYNDIARYCRSFSAYSVQLYFDDTRTPYEKGQTEKYSELLHKMFTSYVSYEQLEEKLDYDARVGTVTGKFTSIDLEKFNETTDSAISSGLKNDFDAQYDYICSIIGEPSLRSEQYKFTVDFRYTNDEWVFADKNFLILLTLGYYNMQ